MGLLSAQPRLGSWRGVLLLDEEKRLELPFNFEVCAGEKLTLIVHNAGERIEITEASTTGDSLIFKMPVFDTEFRTKLHGDTSISGYWINHSKAQNNRIAFLASYGAKSRFLFPSQKPGSFYDGKWEVCFSPQTTDSSKAIGLFRHVPGTSVVEGTFRTETGDYRYLEGTEQDGKLYLSCFDGSHAFLFIADTLPGGNIEGTFYSGISWREPWTARRNEAFELRDPEKLTYLKDPKQRVAFSFQDGSGQTVSLNDARYRNKVVIVQVMGSWCPNCMDETAYLARLYERYQAQGLEVLGLAYERTTDPEKARNNVKRLKERFGVKYDILITGLTGKDKASQSLPFLNGIMAFPTTLILDKDHQAVSVYTGFNGPATGKAYEDYVIKTEKLIKSLLK